MLNSLCLVFYPIFVLIHIVHFRSSAEYRVWKVLSEKRGVGKSTSNKIFFQILPCVWVSGKSKMAACNRECIGIIIHTAMFEISFGRYSEA